MHNVENGLMIEGRGTCLQDCEGALRFQGLYRNFEVIVHATVGAGAGMGVGMYYSSKYSVGFGLKDCWIWSFWPTGAKNRCQGKPYNWNEVYLKMVIHEQVLSMYFSPDGEHWEKTLNSTNFDHISSLASIPTDKHGSVVLPALYAYGNGNVTFHSFEMNELPEEDPEPEEFDY